jgi:hypothetical protein
LELCVNKCHGCLGLGARSGRDTQIVVIVHFSTIFHDLIVVAACIQINTVVDNIVRGGVDAFLALLLFQCFVTALIRNEFISISLIDKEKKI